MDPPATSLQMQDLTRVFLGAAERRDKWGSEACHKVISAITKEHAPVEIDWDEDAGEQWARIYLDDKDFVAIFAIAPIAMVVGRPEILGQVATMLKASGLAVIHSEGWADVRFSLNAEVVRKSYPDLERLKTGDAIDLSAFSPWDLWYATIT